MDLCTQIVEAKGLEMTGVYRIPGNKAAVTLLQEEFNKVFVFVLISAIRQTEHLISYKSKCLCIVFLSYNLDI